MMFTIFIARSMPVLFLRCEMDEEACFCSFFPIRVTEVGKTLVRISGIDSRFFRE